MSHHNVVAVCASARRYGATLTTVVSLILLAVLTSSAIAASPESAGETFPASVTAGSVWAGGEGTSEFTPVSISDDGRYVAFQSAADNLGETGPAGVNQGFVKDLASGDVRLVSRADGEGGEAASEPGISGLRLSGDGRYVIFTSAATNLGTTLPGEVPGERHVYRRDLQSGDTTLVDRVSGAAGAILSRGAEASSISANGRYVAFTARVENLEDPVGDHTETANAVGYVRDMQTESTVAVSRASGATGEVGDEPAEGLSLSSDGRYVVFSSRASNLVPGVEEGVWEQVYLRDLQTSTTTLISQNELGEPGDRGSSLSVISGEGACKVQFTSIAFNLLEPSPLEVSGEQVYVADRCLSPQAMTLVSRNANEPIAPFAYSVSGTTADGASAIFVGEFVGSACCHLYLRDFEAGTTTQLDRASGASGASANAEVQETAISANGCRAVFASRATNLFAGGPPQGPSGEEPTEVYVRQLAPCVDSPETPGAEAGASPSPQPKSPATVPKPAAQTSMKVTALNRRKLVLGLSGPGRVAVRVRRLEKMSPRHWKFLRTITAEVGSAGRVEIPLPDFSRGKYRFNLHLHRSQTPGIVRFLAID
jgi:Tol biopolymer transport system component